MRSGEEIQTALRPFVAQWRSYVGTEKAEAQTFLNELFACYGSNRGAVGARFEDFSASAGFMDLHWPGECIVEMKAPNKTVHRRIVHRLTRRVTDRAPESPPCPGPAIDPDQATRLPIAHPVRDQPNEPVLLLRQRTTRMRRSRPSHRNLRLPSSVATFTGICPVTPGPTETDTATPGSPGNPHRCGTKPGTHPPTSGNARRSGTRLRHDAKLLRLHG